MNKNKYKRAYGFYLLTNEYFSMEYEKLLKENDLLKQKDRVNYMEQRLNSELDSLSKEEIELVNSIMKSSFLNFIQKRMMLSIGVPRLFSTKIKDKLEHILIMSGIGKEWTELLYNYVLLGSFDETLAPSDISLPTDKDYEDAAIWWRAIVKKNQADIDAEHHRADYISYLSIGEEVFGSATDSLPNDELDIRDKRLEQKVKKRVSDFRKSHRITLEWEDYLYFNL